MFKSSIAKIVTIVLLLKIVSNPLFYDIFIPQFLLTSFRPSPELPRRTCGLFSVTPMHGVTAAEDRCRRQSLPVATPTALRGVNQASSRHEVGSKQNQQ
jgi:hypothetical protein